MPNIVAPLTGHLDAALSQFAKGFRQNGLIADQIAPRVGVARQTDKYWITDRSFQKVQATTLRGMGAPAKRVRMTLSSDSYFAESHALAAEIPMEESAAYTAVGNLRQDTTQMLMAELLLDKEIAIAALLTDTAKVTVNVTLAGGDQFSDLANSDPIGVIETAKSAIRLSGQEANTLVLTDPVFQVLKKHPEIIERFKYVQAGSIGTSELASVFGIANILFATAVKVDAADAASFVWGKDMLVAYVSQTPGNADLSLAKTFVWEGGPGTIGGIGAVYANHPDPTAKSEILGVDMYYAQKVTAVEGGYLIKAAVA